VPRITHPSTQLRTEGIINQPNPLGVFQQPASGVFDAATRTLSLQNYVPWKNQHGTATLHVSADEGTLSGVWQLPTIGRGAWTFVRTAGPIPAQGSPPNNQPPAVTNLAGAWCSTAKPGSPELPASIAQNGTTLRFRNEYGMMSSGHFVKDGRHFFDHGS
jgi:hypothetical protein